MQWAQQNWRVVGAVLVGLIWAAKTFGPSGVRYARERLAALKPAVEQKTTILSAWPVLAIAILLGPSLIPAENKPITPPAPVRVPDLFDTCAASGRALLADELDRIASSTFETEQAKEDAINTKILDVLDASFEPFHSRLGKAVKANRLTEFAAKVREGEIRE